MISLVITRQRCRSCGEVDWVLMPINGCWTDAQCRACHEMTADACLDTAALPVDPSGAHAARYAMTFPEVAVSMRWDQTVSELGRA